MPIGTYKHTPPGRPGTDSVFMITTANIEACWSKVGCLSIPTTQQCYSTVYSNVFQNFYQNCIIRSI